MNREQKAAAVQEIADQLQSAAAVFAVDYRGISVPQAAELRARLRDADATFRIVKNSLTERAADKAGTASLRSLLEGPTALTFVRGDAALAAKALADFARTRAVLDFKGGLMGGEELSAEEIRSIARLPARDVLYAQMVGTVAAPLTGLVRGLNGLVAGLAVQLQQIVDQGLLPRGDGGAAQAQSAPEATEAPAAAEEPGEAESQPQPEGAEPTEQVQEADASAPAAGGEDAPAPAAGEESQDEQAPGESAPSEDAASEDATGKGAGEAKEEA